MLQIEETYTLMCEECEEKTVHMIDRDHRSGNQIVYAECCDCGYEATWLD